MNAKCLEIFVVILAAAILGCATAPQSGDVLLKPDQVRVYAPEEPVQGRYEIIKRLQVQAGSAALQAPEHPTAAQGIAVLKAEAARLGANGLINVACRGDDQGQSSLPRNKEPAFICSGTAIRVRSPGS